jgi:Ca2+-binding RTX toxin-like protein
MATFQTSYSTYSQLASVIDEVKADSEVAFESDAFIAASDPYYAMDALGYAQVTSVSSNHIEAYVPSYCNIYIDGANFYSENPTITDTSIYYYDGSAQVQSGNIKFNIYTGYGTYVINSNTMSVDDYSVSLTGSLKMVMGSSGVTFSGSYNKEVIQTVTSEGATSLTENLKIASDSNGNIEYLGTTSITLQTASNTAKITTASLLMSEDMDPLAYLQLALAGDDTITGAAGNQTLEGYSGNDVIDGGGGEDVMIGGAGNDTYLVDHSNDQVIEQPGEGTDLVKASVSYGLTENVEKLTLLGTNAINGTGNDLDNALTGNGAANRLDGGLGADTLLGGAGNDTYMVDNAGDKVYETTTLSGTTDAGGTDTVESSVTWTLGSYVERLTLTGSGHINGTGNSLANILTGNAGNNVLDGKGGSDTLVGGLGDDTYVVDATGDAIIEAADEGTDTVNVALATAGSTYTLGANVENATVTSTVAINLTGSNVANVLTGNSAANKLDGKEGADTLIGGAGGDTYVVDDEGDTIDETSAITTEIDTVQSSVDWTLGSNLEKLTLTGTADLDGTGNGLNNTLTGTSGANRLDGGLGTDTLLGGAGDDTYVVDHTGDKVYETTTATSTTNAGGTDTVESSVTWTLGNYVENLILTGSAAINGTGNSLANRLTGNEGNNVLSGGTGLDSFIGGEGNDTYVVDQEGELAQITEAEEEGTDTVQVGYANASTTTAKTISLTGALAEIENVTISGTGRFDVIGNDVANILTGNASSNILTGNAGNDTLDGKGGSDTLVGGLGDDTYVVDATGDVITEAADQGTDTVNVALATAGATYTLGANVENAMVTGTVAINLTGSNVANVLTGNSAANKLDGKEGADTLIGGAGGDTYVVDDVGDTISEVSTVATEIDTVQASVDWTLGSNLEKLTLTGTADLDGTGNGLNNTLTGTSGANRLDGGLGADTMLGGAGNDTYVVDNTADKVYETTTATSTTNAGGTDTVESSVTWTLGNYVENLILTGSAAINGTGNSLANRLTGNEGNNVLSGGTGVDTYAGGEGDDTYVLDQEAEFGTLTELADEGRDTLQIGYANASTTTAKTVSLTGALAEIENVTISGTGRFDVIGNDVANILTGNASTNRLEGGDGNDTLDGKGGNDTLVGGLGDDTYVVDATGDAITEAADEGTDTVNVALATAGSTYTLGANVENATVTGTAAINLTGSNVANVLTGNSAANKLDGKEGTDTLIGGAGGDTYVVDDEGDTIDETSAITTEIDTVQSSVDWTLGSNLEKLTLTGTADLDGTGNGLNNTLTGTSGANRLDGGLGADTLLGGAGDDTYVVDHTGDKVYETTTATSTTNAGGTDTVESSVTWTLGNYVENLILTGSAAINGTGNSLANRLTGNEGNNVLSGGTGLDSFIGGEGNDTYVVDQEGELAQITEAEEEGTDTVQVGYANASTTTAKTISLTGALAEIENVTISGTGRFDVIGNDVANILTGNASSNILTGNAGNDTLDGKGGSDTLVGGLGDDTYVVDATGDVITEAADQGTDTVNVALATAGATYTLGANVENATVTGTVAIKLTGNDDDNILTGNGAANTLKGMDGDDTLDGKGGIDVLQGGTGNDTYWVDLIKNSSTGNVSLQDTVTENLGEGTDTLHLRAGSLGLTTSKTIVLGANIENADLTDTGSNLLNLTGNVLDNTLTGNQAANTLSGGEGNDALVGGLGNDILTGGNGNDTFVFDVELGTSNVDQITDFQSGDLIQLDAEVFEELDDSGALSAEAFCIGTHAADENSRIVYDDLTGALYYDVDGSGIGAAVQFATLTGLPTLSESDFFVV